MKFCQNSPTTPTLIKNLKKKKKKRKKEKGGGGGGCDEVNVDILCKIV